MHHHNYKPKDNFSKCILIISPEPWNGHAVSKHHYAIALASAGYRVLFLDPPEHGQRYLKIERLSAYEGLERVRDSRIAPALSRIPGGLRRYLERRWLNRLERQARCHIAVIWLFENSRFFDLRFAGSRLKIYHQVDLNQNFHPEIAAQTADICFCTSELIRQRLLPHNSRTYLIQHGVEISPSLSVDKRYDAYLDSEQPKAAYIGNLAIPYLDWEAMSEVIHAHPQVQFHLIGGYDPLGHSYLSLKEMKNVIWWGQVDSSAIQPILARMDILLICYSQTYVNQVSNPHKLMEYLASGRTVVATYTYEYRNHQDLLCMTGPGSNSAFIKLFRRVLNNLEFYNSPRLMLERRAFAEDNRYTRQISRIKHHLSGHGFVFPEPKK